VNARSLVRRLVPFAVRLEVRRMKRWPAWLVERSTLAHTRLSLGDRERFNYLLACHQSPLDRTPGTAPPRLQRGKERNISLAASMLDGLVIQPFEIFSYHRVVGRPTRWRGFRPGLELREGAPSCGVGGGCCQISNMLHLLALRSGMKIVERHRHGLDLFPDHQRTVPFGCGATIFYNYADLRFENPLSQPVLLRLTIQNRMLVGEIWTTDDPGWTVEVYEVGHRFFREGEHWMRENHIHRRFRLADGSVLLDEEVAHNRGRILYEPPEEALCGEP